MAAPEIDPRRSRATGREQRGRSERNAPRRRGCSASSPRTRSSSASTSARSMRVMCAGLSWPVSDHVVAFYPRGRRRDGHHVLVTSSAPLDQFLARASRLPARRAPVEEARIDPRPPESVQRKCAAFDSVQARPQSGFRRRRCGGPRRRWVPPASRRGAEQRHVPLGGRRVPGPTTCRCGRRLGQRRHHRCRARQDARRDRLARRAMVHNESHLPARWRVLAGREVRLREPQGVRPQGEAGLLDRRDDVHDGERHGEFEGRSRSSSTRADHPRTVHGLGRGRRSWKGRQVQEDQFIPTRTGYGDVRLPRCRCTRPRSGSRVPGRSARTSARRSAARRHRQALRGVGVARSKTGGARAHGYCDPRDLGTTLRNLLRGRRRPQKVRGGAGYNDALLYQAHAGHQPLQAHLRQQRRPARAHCAMKLVQAAHATAAARHAWDRPTRSRGDDRDHLMQRAQQPEGDRPRRLIAVEEARALAGLPPARLHDPSASRPAASLQRSCAAVPWGIAGNP